MMYGDCCEAAARADANRTSTHDKSLEEASITFPECTPPMSAAAEQVECNKTAVSPQNDKFMKSDFQTGNGNDTHIKKKNLHRFSEKYGPDSDLLALLHAATKCVPECTPPMSAAADQVECNKTAVSPQNDKFMKSDFQTGNGNDKHIKKKNLHRFSEKYGPDSDLLALLHAATKSEGLYTNMYKSPLLEIAKKIMDLGLFED
jgi:hypothetical protein